MNSIISLAFKDLKLMTRDKVGLFFIFGFPIIMGLFFGYIMGGNSSGGSKMHIAVVDLDQSEMSKKAIGGFTGVEVEMMDDRKAAVEAVKKGKKIAVVVIPKGFGEKAGIMWEQGEAIELGIDPSRPAEKGMLQGLLMEANGKLMAERFQNVDSMKAMTDKAREDLANDLDTPVYLRLALNTLFGSFDTLAESLEQSAAESEDGDSDNPMNGFQLAQIKDLDVRREIEEGSQADTVSKLSSKWDISFPSAMMWGVLGCVAGFAISIVRENKQGTMLRLKVAPIPRGYILAGKGLACFLSVCFVIVVMVVLGVLLGMRPDNYPLLVVASICVGIAFVGLMMTMSVIGKTEEAVSGAGWGACVLMAMFGGGMIPLAFMPPLFQQISNLSPVKWGVLAIEGAIWRQFTMVDMLLPCGVLLGIGAAGFAIGLTIMKRSQTF